MKQHLLAQFSMIPVLGVLSQWIAWRLHVPAILMMLIVGLIAGPLTGLIEPTTLFGNILNPIIALSVAIILFEGSLGLI